MSEETEATAGTTPIYWSVDTDDLNIGTSGGLDFIAIESVGKGQVILTADAAREQFTRVLAQIGGAAAPDFVTSCALELCDLHMIAARRAEAELKKVLLELGDARARVEMLTKVAM